MSAYANAILKRVGILLIVIFGVTIMTFSLIHAAPGDPAEMIAMARYGDENLTRESIEEVRQLEGFDKPIIVQYGKWLGNVLTWDLGYSLISGDEISGEISARVPATLQLALFALIISLAVSIPTGIFAAVNYGKTSDRVMTTLSMIFSCIPNFWLGLLLILLFSVTLGWLPSFGHGGLNHIILPGITLGAGMAAVNTRLTRSSMVDVLKQDYIVTARSKGVPAKKIVMKHGFKNAFIPVLTMIGLQLGSLLEGTVIVESIFGWPGIGKLLVDSIFARDYFMVQGCVFYFAMIVTVINIIIDLLYLIIDPRIRCGKGGVI